jgi:tetratricopeptide (TPR) repeat protein
MLAIARSAGDVWGIGQALLHRGNAWLNARKLRRAEQAYREAESWAREQGDDWLLGRVLNNLFYCLKERNDHLASQVIEESIQAKKRSGDRRGLAAAYAARGILAADADLHREALTWFRRAERTARKFGDRYGQAQALHNQCKGLQALGRHNEAVSCQRRACAIARKLERQDLLELTSQGLAVALYQAGRYRAALPKFFDLYETKLVRGDISGALTAMSDAGMMAFKLSDHSTARRCFRNAIRVGIRHKRIEHVEYPILNLSVLLMKEGKPRSALRFLSDQLDRWEDVGHWKVVIALARLSIAIRSETHGAPTKIEALWMRALAAAKKQRDVETQIDLLQGRYAWTRDRGDTVAALRALKPLMRLSRRQGLVVEYLEAINEFSNRIQELGHNDRAEKLYRGALEIAREVKSDRLSSTILNNLAETLRLTGRADEALPFYREAADLDRDEDGLLLVEHNLALALDTIGDKDQAKRLLESVRDRSRYGKHWFRYGNAWLALGDMALDAGEKRSAVSHYHAARKVGAAHGVAELVNLADQRIGR